MAGLPLLLLGAWSPVACLPGGEDPESDETEVVAETIEEALERVTPEWMEIPGVEGTGIGVCDGRPCIKVFVSRPVAELDPPLPERVGGHPVRAEPGGPFRARDSARAGPGVPPEG